MKRFILVAVTAIITMGVSLAQAATTAPTPGTKAVAPMPTRVALPKGVVTPNPALKNINIKMMEQMRDIAKAQHSGKITKDQAKVLRDKVKSIRKQQLDFMKANGKKAMTPDQESQINQALDANAKTLQ